MRHRADVIVATGRKRRSGGGARTVLGRCVMHVGCVRLLPPHFHPSDLESIWSDGVCRLRQVDTQDGLEALVG